VARGVMLGTADLRLSATHYEGCSRAMLASSNPRFLQVQRGVADCDRWLLMAVRGHLGTRLGRPIRPRAQAPSFRYSGVAGALLVGADRAVTRCCCVYLVGISCARCCRRC
jgi:hypothetical protein